MRLIPIDPEDIENVHKGNRGRVSYPILKMFLESGHQLVKLNPEDIEPDGMPKLYMNLRTYTKSHPDMPARVFRRDGEIYLVRTDIDTTSIEDLNAAASPDPSA